MAQSCILCGKEQIYFVEGSAPFLFTADDDGHIPETMQCQI